MWPDASETQRLLERIEREGAPAEQQLWERHREPLRRLVGLRLDPALARRVDASDVVQEVLLKASQRLADYLRNPAAMPFHLWLRQIARDHIIDEYRRHRLAARRSLDREQTLAPALVDRSSLDLAAQLRDPSLTPAAAVLRRELERRFHEALSLLDEADREVILLRHFERLANVEVARVLEISEAAAGMRHLRALRRLRSILGEPPSRSGPG